MKRRSAADRAVSALRRDGTAGLFPGLRAAANSHERYLHKCVAQVERRAADAAVRDVTTNDCRAFLDNWIGKSPSTVATIHSALNGLFTRLYMESEIDANPMTRVARPRRPRPGDVDVVIVTSLDVERMFAAVETWQELLCLSVLAYTGIRRASAAGLRWREVDLASGTIRVREKGNKVSTKPVSTTHPGALESLQALMSHSRIDTTEVYLRAFNRDAAMEAVRDLSWNRTSGFQSDREKAHTGFEPVPPP